MNSIAKRTILLLTVAAVLAFAGNATATVEGLRVSTPDTCWYTGNFIAFPVSIEWTTWSQHPNSAWDAANDPLNFFRYNCDNAEYWVHPSHDIYIYPNITGVPGITRCTMPGELHDTLRPPLPDQEMCSFEMVVTFNDDVMQAVSVSNSDLLDDDWEWGDVYYEIDNAAGRIYIAIAAADCQDLTDLDDPTELIEIGFYIDGDLGDHTGFMVERFVYNEVDPYYVFVDNREYDQDIDQDGMAELIYTGNKSIGDFMVCETLYATGWVKYMSNQYPICDADVTLEYIPDPDAINPPSIPDKMVETLCCCVTGEEDTRGRFFIPEITSGYDYCVGVWHDDEDAYDAAITAFDASLILRHAVGQFHFRDFHQFAAADVSGNCEVSAYDASLILKWLVHEFDYFPKKRAEETNWLFFPVEENELCPDESYCWWPMMHSQRNVNFWAVILGDVSGNWGSGMTYPKPAAGDPIRIVQVESDANGSVYEIRTSLPEAYGCTFDVLTSVTGAVTVRAAADWFQQTSTGTDRIRVAAAGATAGNVLARIEVPRGIGDVEVRNLVVNEFSFEGASYVLKGSESVLPDAYGLSDAYPNPFNPSTNISFSLPQSADIKLSVFNILGREVKTLATGTFEAGTHTVTWDGTNDAGGSVSTGLYLYRLETPEFTETKKMMLLK